MLEPHLLKQVGFILFNQSPLKTKKNAFYIILKALFFIKIFLNFCPDSFRLVGKRLNQKAKVNFEISHIIN